MKKFFKIGLILFCFLAFYTPVHGVALEESIDISVTASASSVKVGERITLKAIVPKHGSSFKDSWSKEMEYSTSLDDMNNKYISEATFIPKEPGVYTIVYQMEMNAGKSEKSFVGKGEYTVEVVDSTTIKEVGVKDLVVTEVVNSQGVISGYRGIGTVYVLWSDNTIMDYSTIFVSFQPDEMSKNVDVIVELDGKKRIYKVNIRR